MTPGISPLTWGVAGGSRHPGGPNRWPPRQAAFAVSPGVAILPIVVAIIICSPKRMKQSRKREVMSVYLPPLSAASCIRLVLAFMLLLASGCRKQEPSTSNKPFRIAIVTWIGHGPFLLAKEKGFFEKQGLNVEIEVIEDIGARRSALLSKNLEGIITSVDAFAVDAARNLPAKTILKLGEGNGADGIVAKQGITSLKDLKGHTVAFPRGEPSHFFLLLALEKVGLTTKDIKPQYMTAGDAGAAFVAGAVDACVTWEPWVTTAKEKGKGNILLTSRDSKGYLVDSFEVRNDVISERREDVKAFMRAWFEAVDYWKKNPDDANKIMAKKLGIPLDDFVAMLGGYKYSDYQDNMKYFGTEAAPGLYWEVFEAANKAWKADKIIDIPGQPSEFTDVSLLRELQ